MKRNAVILSIVGFITIIGNWIGYNISIAESFIGMVILVLVAVVGWWLSKVIPIKVEAPTVIWISLLALLIGSPIFPGNQWIVEVTNKINFMAITTPVLAYAGLSLGKDIKSFKKLSWRIILISLVVYTGTFILATLFAQIILKINGTI